MNRKFPMILVALTVLVTVVGAGFFMSETGRAARADHGKAAYAEQCASCHGENFEGQPNWKTRNAEGRLPAPPHDATGHTWHHADELLFRITKFGSAAIAGEGYQSDMKGYKDILSDDEIRAVLGYIKSSWPEKIRKRQELISKRSKKK